MFLQYLSVNAVGLIKRNGCIALSLLFVFVARIVIIYEYPDFGGDSSAYKTVAANIFTNKCISLSKPELGECSPHWGGNQLPGYPILIALSYFLLGEDDRSPLLLTTFFFMIGLIRLTQAAGEFGISRRKTGILAFIVGLSPLHIGHARFVLTEQIIIVLSILIVAELMLALSRRSVPIKTLAVLFSLAFYFRYDSIAMLVPILAAISFCQVEPSKAILNLSKFLLFCSIPAALVTIRHVYVGIDIFPKPSYVKGTTDNPEGYVAWARSWMSKSQHQEAVMYPIANANFNQIRLPLDAPLSATCRVHSEELIGDLKRFQGEGFPNHIDKKFSTLASSVCKKDIYENFLLQTQRIFSLWFNLPASFGLPTTQSGLTRRLVFETRTVIVEKSWHAVNTLSLTIKQHFLAIAGRGLANLYWICLTTSVLLILVLRRNSKQREIWLLQFGVIYSFLKTVFLVFVIQTTFETRLLASVIPFLEVPLWLYLLHPRGPENGSLSRIKNPYWVNFFDSGRFRR